MVSKKEEHDALEQLSEKDLWCQDLDAFVAEWELQLKEEADYQKSIRNTNRRASRKIGAGKNVSGRGRPKQDGEYNPKPAKSGPSKVVKVEQKPHQRFLSMFENKPKPKPKTSPMGSDGAEDDEISGMSDGDFDMLRVDKGKPAAAIKEGSRAPSEQPANGRVKRAAAAAPKKWVIEDDESESEGGGEFDVGDMVKGIGGADLVDTNGQNGRLSLFAMSRPGSSHGRATSEALPKLKSKPSKIFNLSDDDDAADETNYEMLAKSSPNKTAAAKNTLDSYLSDSDDLAVVPVTKKVPVKAAAPAAKSKTGRPKKAPAPKAVEAAQTKPVALSPAAKAYAAKQNKMKLPAKRNVISDDEDEDVGMEEADSPAPKPATKARGRPPRAAAVSKPKKPIYIDSDDDEMDIDDNDESALVDEASEDDFDDSD
jgi:DNA topoisomerase-2